MPYLNLTKPRISLLVAITGLAALIVEGSLIQFPLKLWLIVLALFLTAGSANAFNQFLERDVDLRMARTAKKRPLPLGQITSAQALIFSIAIGAIGVAALIVLGGWLAGGLGVATIAFYALYYTLWLKPRTPYNIVIGGIAGSMGPVIAWAAATGTISWAAFMMFLIIFFWTPPHFWALALCCKEDYAKVNYPMLPLVAGDQMTRKQILYYSITLIPLSVSLFFVAGSGWLYLVSSIVLTVLFIGGAWRLYQKKTIKVYWQFFAYSIVYLMVLFIMMMADRLFLGPRVPLI